MTNQLKRDERHADRLQNKREEMLRAKYAPAGVTTPTSGAELGRKRNVFDKCGESARFPTTSRIHGNLRASQACPWSPAWVERESKTSGRGRSRCGRAQVFEPSARPLGFRLVARLPPRFRQCSGLPTAHRWKSK